MKRNRIAALVAALLLVPALVACGGEELSERAVEDAMEDAAGDAGTDVDVDIEGDEVTIEGEDGTFTVGDKLPDDFPSDDIALVDGDIVSSQSMDGASFTVIIATGSSAEDAVADAVGKLEDKGFSVIEDSPMASAGGAELSNDTYLVKVLATEGTINYVIEKQGG